MDLGRMKADEKKKKKGKEDSAELVCYS